MITVALIFCIIFTGLAFSLTSSKFTHKLEIMIYSKELIDHNKFEEYLSKAKFYHMLAVLFSWGGVTIGVYLMLKHL